MEFKRPGTVINLRVEEKINRCNLLEPFRELPSFYCDGQLINRISMEVSGQNRYYYQAGPKSEQPSSLIIWLHGSRQDALAMGIYGSNLLKTIEQYNYCLVLPQANGKRKSAHKHSKYLDISFGKLYWEIRDQVDQFNIDKQFISDIIDQQRTNPTIESVYLMGFSNGGVFACLMAMHLRDKLTAVVSFAGGIGHDAHVVIDPKSATINSNPIRLILITGKKDSHYYPTLAAKNIFEDFDYEPELHIIENLAHKYRISEESMVLSLLYTTPIIC